MAVVNPIDQGIPPVWEPRYPGHQGGFHGQHQGQSSGGSWQQASQADQLADAYKILDVSSDVDSKTVKRAYRKLMSQYHPDKLISKGLPEEMLNFAKEKTQQVQAAYELIQKHRS